MSTAREDIRGGWKPTTLSIGLAGAATTATVAAGGLTTWTPVSHGRIPVVINRGQADEEHLYAAAVAGDTLTGLTRGQDGTADQAHAAGATVEHGLFATHIDKANEFLSLPTAAGQIPVSTAADTWGVDDLDGLAVPNASLANPTLTSPNIGTTEWTDANHGHAAVNSGGTLPTASPTASAPGDTASTGTAGTYATGPHRHPRTDGYAASAAASAPGDAGTAGTSADLSRGDHKHAREAFATSAAALVPDGAGSGGAAATVSRGDHVHPLAATSEPLDGVNRVFQDGTVAYSMSSESTKSVTKVFPILFGNVPVVQATLFNEDFVRLNVNISAVSASAVVFRIDHVDGTSVTTSGVIYWRAEAVR